MPLPPNPRVMSKGGPCGHRVRGAPGHATHIARKGCGAAWRGGERGGGSMVTGSELSAASQRKDSRCARSSAGTAEYLQQSKKARRECRSDER
eukprot:scaffold86885_cov26-Tisochrysis_lutea.AAC.3